MKTFCRRGSGFTLIELLVVIGIISILIALLLPAAQAARETARRAMCQHNLRQLGLALHSYHDSNQSFPISITNVLTGYGGFYSAHVRLLPFLDQRPLYDSVNFTVGTFPLEMFGGPSGSRLPPHEAALNAANATAFQTQIALFLCPSDDGPFDEAGTNFRGNTGVGPHHQPLFEHPDGGNGLLPELRVVNMARVPDGLSHTAAFSERLRGSGQDSFDLVPERDYWDGSGFVRTADDILQMCRIAARPGSNPGFVLGGRWWFWTGRERTLYNHAQVPNGKVPDCIQGAMRTTAGMATARSWHNSGVNVVMGDGSTRFVAETIDQAVWRGLGSRNGRELVE